MTRVGLFLVVALAVAGCSGDGGGEEKTLFTMADATRIAGVRPQTPDWTWPQDPAERHPFSSEPTPAPTDVDDPRFADFLEQTAGLDARGEVANKWKDDDKLANLVVGMYGSGSDAHSAMGPFNALSRGWGEEYGEITRDEDVEGLGNEAWVLWVRGTGGEVTYHWRRDNLVLEAHVHCYGFCPGDVDEAAREWADAVDKEATSG